MRTSTFEEPLSRIRMCTQAAPKSLFDLLSAPELRPKLNSFAEIVQALGPIIEVIILAKAQEL